jgi:hypothetical protein
VTVSDEWFDEYLAVNGYTFEREPDLGVRTRPDRLIERVGVEAICEVKELRPTRYRSAGRTAATRAARSAGRNGC